MEKYLIKPKDTINLLYNQQINFTNEYKELDYSIDEPWYRLHSTTHTHEMPDSELINPVKVIINGIKFLENCNNSKPSRQQLLNSLLDLIDKIKKGKIKDLDQIKQELAMLTQLIKQEVNNSLSEVSDLCVLIDSIAGNDFDPLTIKKFDNLLNQIKTDNSTQNVITIINNICGSEFNNYNDIVNYLSSTSINPEAMELATMVLFSDALNSFELAVSSNNPEAKSLVGEATDFQNTLLAVANNIGTNNINTDVDLFSVISNITTNSDTYSNLPQLIKLLESYNINWKSGAAIDRMLVSDIFRNKILEINNLVAKLKPGTKKSPQLSTFDEDEKKYIIVSQKKLTELSDECEEILNSI